ncbi:GNAT family N-acetyltransferase [Psychromarinibacter sp. C21-152]|uniref:GNAT family N-acetyltransferase n=1 Tax=Psychromarinibacter sediminicola TaxID=3033385 RepID=A0AAE3NME8_9RHOB|nr:GNAT family N-acetyltransferase [Psychromarinibacter sediminicola]MDF0600543.1 GNAT family N-acetyltransferase [Psychromarinibacter sediminicola]
MIAPIRTDRLLLRPLRPADAPALADGIADFDIVQWLSRVPWPYGLRDAEAFVAMVQGEGSAHYAVTEGGAVVGVVSTADELGYWIRRSAQGRGLATEAARAAVAAHFAGGADRLTSGHRIGNDRSRRVLLRLGFSDTHRVEKQSLAAGAVTVQRMELTRAAWHRLRAAPERGKAGASSAPEAPR